MSRPRQGAQVGQEPIERARSREALGAIAAGVGVLFAVRLGAGSRNESLRVQPLRVAYRVEAGDRAHHHHDE